MTPTPKIVQFGSDPPPPTHTQKIQKNPNIPSLPPFISLNPPPPPPKKKKNVEIKNFNKRMIISFSDC